MADDAAGVLRALDIASAHVAGFSGGSIIAQELALRHPELVRSLVLQSTWPVMDAYLGRFAELVRWLVEAAPSERAFLEWFFTFIYTPRAHNDGTVEQIIEEAVAFPYGQAPEDTQQTLDAFIGHEHQRPPAADRGADAGASRRPRHDQPPGALPRGGRADPRRPIRGHGGRVPPALPGGAWNDSNARADAFWRDVEAAS